MFEFYRNTYLGTALEEGEFAEALLRAQAQLEHYDRCYRVSGDENKRKLALCAMADAIAYFQAAQNGEGGLRYAKVGTVSVSGKGIYSAIDISPQAQERELYRIASRYLDIYRGHEPGRCW